VRQNLVHDNRSDGIAVEASQNCIVYYNVLYNNAEFSSKGDVHIESQSGLSASNIAVHHNVTYGTGYAKIEMVDGGAGFNNVLVFENIFAQTTRGNRFGEYRIPLSGSGNVIGKNCYATDVPFLVSANGGTKYSSLATWIASGGQDKDSVNADPAFLNPSARDLRLASGSPCASAGVPDAVVVGAR
jgi:parallel beta-helix repeat protein